MLVDDVGAEEERGALERLCEEVGGEERDPLEDREAGARLEDEHGNCLLQDEAHDDSSPDASISIQSRRRVQRWGDVPWDVLAVPGGGPEAELEDEQTEDRDRTVAVGGAL